MKIIGHVIFLNRLLSILSVIYLNLSLFMLHTTRKGDNKSSHDATYKLFVS